MFMPLAESPVTKIGRGSSSNAKFCLQRVINATDNARPGEACINLGLEFLK
jgi:hypothetical protein